MIWIGAGLLWGVMVWMVLGICKVGAISDERMEREFQQFLRENEGCSQNADGLLHEEGAVNG